jgi:HAD superfamily hydrolase (TIGR01509 family)
MYNAFIFDMDGVIIDTERTWGLYEKELQENLYGKEIAEKIGSTVGIAPAVTYDLAVSYGFSMDREVFFDHCYKLAEIIYKKAPITKDFEKLIAKLVTLDCKIGLVSASPQSWIDLALAKTPVSNKFDYILSLHEREDLQHKPAPDGYLEAMRELGSNPAHTIILEDSNRGIQSAKASGAFTIGFRQFLVAEYQQTGADVYADTMEDVIKIAAEKFR